MVKRAVDAVFVGGAHVFPGGGVDAADRSGPAAAACSDYDPWKAAALREVLEEAGVALTSPQAGPEAIDRWRRQRGTAVFESVHDDGFRFDGSRLHLISNWVTPPGPPRRFDTRFYLASVDSATEAVADGVEVTDPEWVTPARALRLADDGAWQIILPTRHHLELLARFEEPAAAVAFAAGRRVARIEPTMGRDEQGRLEVRVPGDGDDAD